MTGRLCGWCKGPLEATARTDARFCSKSCRQSAFRLRRSSVAQALSDGLSMSRRWRPSAGRDTSPETRCSEDTSPETRCSEDTSPVHEASKLHQRRAGNGPLRLAYADPPYPGMAHLYRKHQDYAGEVDHRRLVERLSGYDGWALSTSKRALRGILAIAPAEIEICPWVKPHGHATARGPSNVHEYVLVSPARRKLPGVRDALYAAVARGGGSDLIGRKPIAFCAWLFALLGAEPQDSFADLFPGSGMVGRCWSEFSRSAITEVTA